VSPLVALVTGLVVGALLAAGGVLLARRGAVRTDRDGDGDDAERPPAGRPRAGGGHASSSRSIRRM
jgi:hypothetical protein